MKNKIIKSIFALVALFTLGLTLTAPVSAATDVCNNPNVPQEVKDASGCGGGSSTDTLPTIVTNILNGVIGVLGVVCVIVIVVGGVWYMTSSGDAGKIKKAKDTILYAVIGLVVCALAAVIVNWTIGALNNPGSTSGGSGSDSGETTEQVTEGTGEN